MSSFIYPHVVSNSFDFASTVEHKKDIVKNVGNQTVSGPIDFHCMVQKYNWSQWEVKLFGTVNNNRIKIFGWTLISLMQVT